MVNVYDMNIWQDTDGTARKPSGISATAPMPEDFPNGQKGVSRLPAVSPPMYSMT